MLVLRYTAICQSCSPFLAYGFGLAVIDGDVGSLREDVAEGLAGLMFRAPDARDLARAIDDYFAADLYRPLPVHRIKIRRFAIKRYSWSRGEQITHSVYRRLASGANVHREFG